jgi:hypothetical protein
MMVPAYPCNYSGDTSALPTLKSVRGADLLRVEFGDYLNVELVKLMTVATRKGAQWLELVTGSVLEDHVKFVEIA